MSEQQPTVPKKRITVSKAHWDAMKEALSNCYIYLGNLQSYRDQADWLKQILENIAAATEGKALPNKWPYSSCVRPYPKDHGLIDDLLAMIEDRIEEHRWDYDHESRQD